MKTDIKVLPLSLTLSFLALLGACSSVNSTPNTEVPSGENSVILEEGEEGVESVEDMTPDELGSETPDGMTDDTAVETETPDGMSEDAAIDTETETPDGMSEDAAIDTETEVTDDIESAEETDPTEIMLPEGDSAEVETDSEAAEGVVETETEIETEE